MNTDATTSSANEIDFDQIGCDEKSVAVAPQEIQDTIDSGLGMKLISIRLPHDLIHQLKIIAEYNEIGYQPFIRKLLRRFADAELKQIALELLHKQKLADEMSKQQSIIDKEAC